MGGVIEELKTKQITASLTAIFQLKSVAQNGIALLKYKQ